MKEAVVCFCTYVYMFAIIALTCYMCVNYSYWWLLLIFASEVKVSLKNNSER